MLRVSLPLRFHAVKVECPENIPSLGSHPFHSDGFERSLLLVNGQTPGPLVEANQGETLAVNVVNELATQVGMHW